MTNDKGESDARTEFKDRRDPRFVKPEQGQTVEVSYFKTGPEHIVEGEVVVVYSEGKFAIQKSGDRDVNEKTWMIDGKELRTGTFREGIDEEEGRISFVGLY